MELSDFVLESIDIANCIFDDKNEQKECYEITSPIEILTKEEAKIYLWTLGNYHSQPNSQEFYFKEIKKTYLKGIERTLREIEEYVNPKSINERNSLIKTNLLCAGFMFSTAIVSSIIYKEEIIPIIGTMYGGIFVIDAIWKYRSNQADKIYQQRGKEGAGKINEIKNYVEEITFQEFNEVMKNSEEVIKERLELD